MKTEVEKDMNALEDAFNSMAQIAAWYINEGDLSIYDGAMQKFQSAIADLETNLK